MNIKTSLWMEKEIWKGKFNFGIGRECGGSHLYAIIYPSFWNLDG